MNILDIINKKVTKQQLNYDEIKYAIDNYVSDKIPDYQMSALLMAITINGMSDEETFDLTNVMLKSGDVIDLSMIKGTVVDKHSTGGVGDKTTLLLAPIVAACGLSVAKMSGRGLGHTGGTIDKLESISNFNVSISNESFIKQINDIGVAIVSQQGNLVPADKKIYELRDVTGTTASIPLIAASIMSKKLASGADKIVIDLKVGKGALINNIDDANHLANLMIKIGKQHNKQVICLLTNMEYPLGNSIGNGLEVAESIEFLKGKHEHDLYELTTTLASMMVSVGKNITEEEALAQIVEVLKNGEAYNKFMQLVTKQGGDLNNISISSKSQIIRSTETGYVNNIDALKIGKLVNRLGGGRSSKNDIIDLSVGFVLNKKTGDYVEENDELLRVYYNEKDIKIKDILDCYTIELVSHKPMPIIYKVVK